MAGFLAASIACAADAPLSCHNTSSFDTCCLNFPGGDLVQTQFWDTNPASGPADSWTIHGLWPDHCDGTYDANCDESRAYTNITQILQAASPATLSYMQTYWKSDSGSDESFWEHEWGKHGTCISTLSPSCYADYRPAQEAADFFDRTVGLFRTLSSYAWLAEAAIVPSASRTYTLSAIQTALQSQFGHPVVVRCNAERELQELWYHFNVRGNVQTGIFTPVDPVGSGSTCPSAGIKYLPKPGATTTTTTGRSATFTTTPAESGFTLSSSKGKCAILSA